MNFVPPTLSSSFSFPPPSLSLSLSPVYFSASLRSILVEKVAGKVSVAESLFPSSTMRSRMKSFEKFGKDSRFHRLLFIERNFSRERSQLARVVHIDYYRINRLLKVCISVVLKIYSNAQRDFPKKLTFYLKSKKKHR